jgi:hypothetical protein
VGENISYLYIRQSSDNKNMQGTQKLNSTKINAPVKKWATKENTSKGRSPNS